MHSPSTHSPIDHQSSLLCSVHDRAPHHAQSTILRRKRGCQPPLNSSHIRTNTHTHTLAHAEIAPATRRSVCVYLIVIIILRMSAICGEHLPQCNACEYECDFMRKAVLEINAVGRSSETIRNICGEGRGKRGGTRLRLRCRQTKANGTRDSRWEQGGLIHRLQLNAKLNEMLKSKP